MAGSAALAQRAFPYARDLAHALNKLSFAARAPGASEVAAVAALRLSADDAEEDARAEAAGRLEALSAAVAAKKVVHLVYAGAERRARTERDVEPYGLYQRGGAWFLAGWCRLREDVRSFHVARIVSVEVNATAPRTPDFTVRPGFSLAELATREPWEFRIHAPVRCRVRLDGPVSPEERESFGARAAWKDAPGGAVVEIEATNEEALLRHVLSHADRAEILAPKALREKARKALAALSRRLG